MHPLKYRPDIDGLRAIAVVSVVLFHAFPTIAPGGYVGVDAFFVISGFLITSLILNNANEGTFSVVDFYARRIKRLYPALIIVLASCLALGWLDMLPHEFRLLGAHALAGAGFWINITLWRAAGYFDLASIQKPLLHLWSLAIEEQFYLLWPCLIVLAYKLGRRPLLMVTTIAVVSLGLNLALVGLAPVSTFYFLPTRAWELLAGACLVWIAPSMQAITLRNPVLNRLMTELPSIVGLLLLLASLAFLDAGKPFPGWRAIPPVLGTMLLICMGPGAIINRAFLSHPVPVGIGLVSYPFYLWHWPALSFPEIVGINGAASRVIFVSLALILSVLTYLFVERRIRQHGRSVSLVLLGCMVLIGGIGLLAKHHVLLPASASPALQEISAAVDDYIYPSEVAQPVPFEAQSFSKEGSAPESIIFVGDSNAEMYFPRARKLVHETGKSIIFAVKGGCLPILDIDQKCDAFTESAFRFAQVSPAKTIVLAALWLGSGGDEDRNSRMFASIRREVADLRTKGKNVFIILRIPYGPEFSPQARTTRHLFWLAVRPPSLVPETGSGRDEAVSDKLKMIAEETGALTIDPFDTLCRDGFCLTADSLGRPAYRDRAHLRAEFVKDYATFIDRVFE